MNTMQGGLCVAVAVSGGVDSLAALVQTVRAKGQAEAAASLGLTADESVGSVLAVTALFTPQSSVDDARMGLLHEVCAGLGVALHVLDLRQDFARLVMQPFAQAYAQGLTPNPCAACNRDMKFGLLRQKALELGATRLATGHYAALTGPVGARRLGRADHLRKDQSYFLSLIAPAAADAVFFPLAHWTKDQARACVEQLGLPLPEPKESQDVCFIPDNAYQDFLQEHFSLTDAPGPICDTEGRVLGRHRGLWRHTIGQRRGLGVPAAHPLYVLEKQRALPEDRLIVGPKKALEQSLVRATGLRLWQTGLAQGQHCLAKISYRSPLTAALLHYDEAQGSLRLDFVDPVCAPAPGQIACAYDEAGLLLAAGVICA